MLNLISSANIAPGVVLNPGTPVSAIEPVLELLDVVVVMCVPLPRLRVSTLFL